METRRLQSPYLHSTSRSLSGMERSLSKPLPALEPPKSSITLLVHNVAGKPLPPPPRRSSSAYSVQDDEVAPFQHSEAPEILLPSPMILQPTAYRSSTTRVPDAIPKRPNFTQNHEVHSISDPTLEIRNLNQQDLEEIENYRSQFSMPEIKPHLRVIPSKQNHNILTEPSDEMKGVGHHAHDYQSVLHTLSAAPPIFVQGPYSTYNLDRIKNAEHHTQDYQSILRTTSATSSSAASSSAASSALMTDLLSSYDYPPSPLSPRITDVIDGSLVPAPLRFSTIEINSRLASRVSVSSSTPGGFHKATNRSFEEYAPKAFHPRRTLPEEKNAEKAYPPASLELRQTVTSAPRRPSKIESFIGQRRISIQHTLSNMYDTLALFSVISIKKKPVINTSGPGKARIPRELRSPAIPITSYQQLGPKAWETRSKSSNKSRSPKSRSNRNSYNKVLVDSESDNTQNPSAPAPVKDPKLSSFASRIAAAFHSDTRPSEKKPKRKWRKAERRREELKKKIVVVRIGETKLSGGDDRNWV